MSEENKTPEKQEDFNREIKVPPYEKIKKGIAIGLILFLLGIIAFSFVRATNKPVIKSESKIEQEQPKEDLSNKKINSSDFGLETSYENQGVKNTTNNEVVEENIPIESLDNQNYYMEDQEPINSLEDEYRASYKEKRYEEELRSRVSNITFLKNENKKTDSNNSNSNNINYGSSSNNENYGMNLNDDPNKQKDKQNFFRNAERNEFGNPYYEQFASSYTVKAGGIIPTILVSGINSDLPSNVIAQVREDVYDTVSGNYLMIPKGTRLIGKYDSGISFGQTRLLLVWQRLIFPNGKSMGLQNFGGVDMSGYAGVTGKVDNHFDKLFQAVVLSSVVGAGTAIVTEDDDDDDDWKSEAGRGAGEQMIDIGSNMANKALNIQPTIEIAQGTRMNVMIHSDLKLTPYKK